MAETADEFQVFIKPFGAVCNLHCRYCYYLEKVRRYPENHSFRMSDDILEAAIVRHVEAHPGPVVNFSWHGGEPTLAGLDFFRKTVRLQRRHTPPGRRVANGIQTNGTRLDDRWCRFFADEGFRVGLSVDGPADMHDRYRVSRTGEPSHSRVIEGYRLLEKHRVPNDILCVLNAHNVQFPLRVYRHFKEIGAGHISFLPLVVPPVDDTCQLSVPPDAFGEFLCTVFDEWVREDVGRIKVQIFEEAARTAFGQDHSLCIFRRTCGDIPILEHNGDVYACDHFVDDRHRLGNIRASSLAELLESPFQRAFGRAKWESLPRYCRQCPVLDMCNGECPKNRFSSTPDGEPGLNVLCAGYRRFFTHCRPFVSEIAALWRREHHLPDAVPPREKRPVAPAAKTGRNAPCPCGSGKKYKKCCLE